MEIISYNINGLRSAISKSFLEWLAQSNFDIVCLQEIKATPEDIPVLELEVMGYKHFWHPAEKKGYSGVATLCRREPDKVVVGCGIEKYDREGRILRTDFGDWSVLNCYFPSGTTGDARQSVKMQFLDDILIFAERLRQERPNLVVVGDFNIAHQEMDIHDPKGNKNSTGFLPEERTWMSKWFDSGFTDAFRFSNPDLVEYSWWSFRAGARSKNKGWRIDYACVSRDLAPRIQYARYLPDVVHSDHCPAKLILS